MNQNSNEIATNEKKTYCHDKSYLKFGDIQPRKKSKGKYFT